MFFSAFSKRKAVLTAVFSAVAAAGAALLWTETAPLLPGQQKAVRFYVPEDSGSSEVCESMREVGVTASAFVLRPTVTAALFSREVKSGWYEIRPGDSLLSVAQRLRAGALAHSVYRLSDGAPIWDVRNSIGLLMDAKHVLITLTDEEVMRRITEAHPELAPGFASIAAQQKLQAQKTGVPYTFSLEGLLAPDTYFYQVGRTDLSIITSAWRKQQKTLEEAWKNRDPSTDRTLSTPYEALILASIIEKETGIRGDRALVSSVFHNRLKIGMPLQTDPSVIYGAGEDFSGNLTRRHLRNDTVYNTYRRKGLPPTPIAAPSQKSIEAALHPAITGYLYFVARGDGTSAFSDNLSDHNQAVSRYILNRGKK